LFIWNVTLSLYQQLRKKYIMSNSTQQNAINEVRFYEGSNQFKVNKTDKNISEEFIQMVLAKQYEYRPTTENLWAVVLYSNIEIARYSFDYNTGLTQIK
jgi:hypothetical protein